MFLKFSFFLFIFVLFFLNNLLASNVYNTEFHHIEVITDNASATKYEEIKKIKIKSFINIINKLLIDKDKKFLLKKFDYEIDIERVIKNIIIENELITKKKYIADIKINFDKEELIYLLRNDEINYTDITTTPFLLLSSYTEDFITSGLKLKNIFYDKNKYDISKINSNLINFKFPDLSPNDRFIIPYKKIINVDIISLSQMSAKYKAENIFIINLKKTSNEYLNIKIYSYKDSFKEIKFIDNLYLINDNNLHDLIFLYLNNWWKNNNLIYNGKINELTCKINSKNYSDLIKIKSKIKKISQFKSMNLLTISYNNNLEKIKYYGDYNILVKSLFLNQIKITNENFCTIYSL